MFLFVHRKDTNLKQITTKTEILRLLDKGKVYMTDKNTDYSNLKEKTILDFCKDEKMIKDLVVSREDFFRDLKEYPLYNAHVLIEYAEITKNKKLLRAVLKQYKQELEEENNE